MFRLDYDEEPDQTHNGFEQPVGSERATREGEKSDAAEHGNELDKRIELSRRERKVGIVK
jgi:hypothetical protein